mgnify:CR=1 FL=1|tara:strand:- start:6256 stop:6627 length:372 start_codon:yes stop_codon:yes gene_type:complete
MSESRVADIIAEPICDQLELFMGQSEAVEVADLVTDCALSRLKGSGYIVVELPSPDSRGRWRSQQWGVCDDGWLKWSVGIDADGIVFATAFRGEGKAANMAAEFRAFASALLSAVATTESEKS